jgi:hypothetical protein
VTAAALNRLSSIAKAAIEATIHRLPITFDRSIFFAFAVILEAAVVREINCILFGANDLAGQSGAKG